MPPCRGDRARSSAASSRRARRAVVLVLASVFEGLYCTASHSDSVFSARLLFWSDALRRAEAGGAVPPCGAGLALWAKHRAVSLPFGAAAILLTTQSSVARSFPRSTIFAFPVARCGVRGSRAPRGLARPRRGLSTVGSIGRGIAAGQCALAVGDRELPAVCALRVAALGKHCRIPRLRPPSPRTVVRVIGSHSREPRYHGSFGSGPTSTMRCSRRVVATPPLSSRSMYAQRRVSSREPARFPYRWGHVRRPLAAS